MVKPISVPGFNIEDIPKDVADTVWPILDVNGGNCIDVDADSSFGNSLFFRPVVFEKDNGNWTWIVIWR
jgi:hypothetical protein